jgi:chromosome segregation ATPase
MDSSSKYREAYAQATRELAELVSNQEKLEKRKVELRKTIESLASLCESEEVKIEPSREAAGLLRVSRLADEVRAVLASVHPAWITPHRIKGELGRLGHDLSRYRNPQATIQMVLKRMVQSGDTQERVMEDGKTAYRHVSLMELFNISLGIVGTDYAIQPSEDGLYRPYVTKK